MLDVGPEWRIIVAAAAAGIQVTRRASALTHQENLSRATEKGRICARRRGGEGIEPSKRWAAPPYWL
jgi:hypothetical protein